MSRHARDVLFLGIGALIGPLTGWVAALLAHEHPLDRS